MREREEENIPDTLVSDSVGLLYNHMVTHTPFNGGLGYFPPYGYLAEMSYRPLQLVIVPSTADQPDCVTDYQIEEILNHANFLSSLGAFLTSGGGMIQANDWFFLNEAHEFVKSPKLLSGGNSVKAFEAASDLAKIGKGVGIGLSVINAGVVVAQMTQEGVNVNNGTDLTMCAIGFVPGVGWVISGVYLFTNAIVTEVTGKTIPEHTKGWLFQKYVEIKSGLDRKIRNAIYGWICW